MTIQDTALVTVANLPATRPARSVEMTSDACIAFSGGSVKKHRCLIVDGNVVKVWDPIAGFYTSCHRMPACFQGRMIIAVTYGA